MKVSAGSTTNGLLRLVSKDNKNRLEGRRRALARPAAGLYVQEEAGVRNSWMVDNDGYVTGVQRRADGSRRPAPGLSADATRVEGDSDDF